MSHQSSSGEAASPSKSSQRTFLDDIMLTFSNPMAWLLIVALIITWSAVAVVLFDLLDYKTLTDYTSYCDDPVCLSPGLPPPSAIARKAIRSRGKWTTQPLWIKPGTNEAFSVSSCINQLERHNHSVCAEESHRKLIRCGSLQHLYSFLQVGLGL
uniref:Triadin n=1 Tax=Oryzias latipes TaxID=8090 RepID=A0A3P9JZB2_ORYLA